MRRMLLPLLLCLNAAFAADLPTAAPEEPGQAALAKARQALDAKKWKDAETALRQALRENPKLADAHNLLGFTLRWQGRYDESLAAYQQVFALEPNHLGAHEYIGQTYLKMGRLDEAESHLKTLQRLCGGCTESKDLAAALGAARAAKQ